MPTRQVTQKAIQVTEKGLSFKQILIFFYYRAIKCRARLAEYVESLYTRKHNCIQNFCPIFCREHASRKCRRR
jgi:hypothetical protein